MIQYAFRKQAFQNRVSHKISMGFFVKHSPMPFLDLKRIAPISALTANHFLWNVLLSKKRNMQSKCMFFKCPLSNAASNQIVPFKHTTSLVLHYSCTNSSMKTAPHYKCLFHFHLKILRNLNPISTRGFMY